MAYRETKRVRERKAAVYERLLNAAESLVREHGFAGLTVQAVAEGAGVGVGTVYRYFDRKDRLTTEVFRRATQREVKALELALSGQHDIAARLRFGITDFARRALSAPRLAWSLIAEPVDPAVDAERLYYREAYARLFVRLIEDGIRSGELPSQSVSVSATALVGCLAEALLGPLADPGEGEDPVEPLCEFCLRAIGAGGRHE